MATIDHALIMAAGRGTRMMPLTGIVPKAMAPYLGSTLIASGIGKVKVHIKNIHITVGYKGPLLAEHVIDLGVSSVFRTDGHGNAWWIYNTLMRYLNEPTFVLTCDNVTELEFEGLAEEYYAFGQPACMVVPVKPIAGLDGDYIFQDSNVVTGLDRQTPSDCYCSGIQIVNPYKINRLTQETDDFNGVWNQLIAQRQVYVSSIFPKRWFAVDTLEQLDQMERQGAWI